METAQARIEALLERRIGLAAESMGADAVAKATQRRMRAAGISSHDAYLTLLRDSEKEWDDLIEAVVVPETWFFRNKESFAYLTRYVRTEWLAGPPSRVLRVLSVPCASGEEPYSIGMALLDTGLPSDRFHIDAMDISQACLEKARRGVYGKESFRGRNLSFQERYFTVVADGHQIDPAVRSMVHFRRANLMEETIFAEEKPYDVVFCRNLLIYLSRQAREQAVRALDRALEKNGLLFVGHVERSLICYAEFSWIRHPGVFACQRTGLALGASGLAERGPLKPGAMIRPVPPPTGRPIRKPALPLSPIVDFAASCPPQARRPPPLPSGAGPARPPEIGPAPAAEAELETAQRLADQGSLEEAFRICEKFLRGNAIHVRAHFLMGLICHAMDEEELAEDAFTKAVYLDPNHHEALSHLAFIMEHRGEWDKAERMRQRARRIRDREEGG